MKRHDNAFGLICLSRTFYLQASTSQELQEWVKAIEAARQTLLATSTQNSVTTPVAKPVAILGVTPTRTFSRGSNTLSSSPPQASYGKHHPFTSSDSEDALPIQPDQIGIVPLTPGQTSKLAAPQKDPAKIILSGYLMKCGSKRRNWRKRWFVLTGEKLVYSGSHMVCF